MLKKLIKLPRRKPKIIIQRANLQRLKLNQRKNLNVVFITVDPERDNIKLLKEYMSNFHPQIKALTGSKKAIEEVVSKYKLYVAKIENPENPGLYTVNHTTILFLFIEKMEFITGFSHDFKTQSLLEHLK
jgi:protein SCO1/2